MPDYRQLTLTLPASGLTLVAYRSRNGEPVAVRSQVGGYRTAGKTRAGATRINRDVQRPWFIWSGNLMVQRQDVAILEAIAAIVQTAPLVQCVLRDEFYPVLSTVAGWHNRAIVPGSTVVLPNGLQQCNIDCNVFLTLPESQHLIYFGAGWYGCQFEAEEII